ncbi:MAG: hypothetical protein IH988_06485, partial [Planctomycetes bacterium]|nr:hypothetical protein [Planctomycetota bacterium]
EFTDLFDELENLPDKFTDLFDELENLPDKFTDLFHELTDLSDEFTDPFNKLADLSHDEYALPWHVVLDTEDLCRVRIFAGRAYSHAWARSQRIKLGALATPVRPSLIRRLAS